MTLNHRIGVRFSSPEPEMYVVINSRGKTILSRRYRMARLMREMIDKHLISPLLLTVEAQKQESVTWSDEVFDSVERVVKNMK